MLWALIVAVVGAVPSLGVILWIERSAQRLAGAPLPRWRRLLIPLPIILFLAANLDGVLSSLAYSASRTVALSRENQAWTTDWFWFGLAFLSFLLLPFVLDPLLRQSLRIAVSHVLLPFVLPPPQQQRGRLILVVWGSHALWLFFVFVPWLLMTRVSLQ